jgi:hypothetical protein
MSRLEVESMKEGIDRSKKYAAKFDATVIQARYTATAQMAKDGQALQQVNLAQVAKDVRAALNAAEVPAMFTIPYMAFGNKLYAICKKFNTALPCAVAREEAWKAICQWYTLGCFPSPLQDIWNTHATILGAAPSPIQFPAIPED